jgi:hypothetical protein
MTSVQGWGTFRTGKRLTAGILLVFMLLQGRLLAESCLGPTYAEPGCSGACGPSYCQDVSFAEDGTLFQCCPPGAGLPELPELLNPITLAVLFGLGLLAFRFLKNERLSGSGGV